MKKKLFNRIFATTVFICCALLFSCKKDNNTITYSQRPGSNNLFVSITGSGNINRTQTVNMLSTATSTVSVGANLTVPSSADIMATISPDTSKVTAYNAANGTQFYLLPSANYQLQSPSNGITIKAGSVSSADSVKISFKNLRGLRASNYLLPITITRISGNASAILGDSVKTVYLNVRLTDVVQPTVSLSTSAGNSINLTYPVGAKGSSSVIPVNIGITPVSPNNVTVATNVDNTLIAGYGSGFTSFPDGSYTISSTTSVINAGQSGSVINVTVTDLSKFDYSKSYLLPVTISKISGDPYTLTGNKTVYVKLNFNNLNNANNASASGTSLVNRTSWNVSATSAFDGTIYGGTNYPVSNAIDGNIATDWIADFTYNGTTSITVDMAASKNVKTIAYTKAYSNILSLYGLSSYPPNVNIYTSTDGKTWVSQGQYQPLPDSGGSVSSPLVNYINFYNAIAARYVRLEIPYYTGFSEVNVFE